MPMITISDLARDRNNANVVHKSAVSALCYLIVWCLSCGSRRKGYLEMEYLSGGGGGWKGCLRLNDIGFVWCHTYFI